MTAESPASSAPPENEDRPLSAKKLGRNRSILRSGRHISRTQQWRHVLITVPWCTLVSGPDDPSTGGALSDPVYAKRLLPVSDRVCPRQMTKVERRHFRKVVRCLFGVNSPADLSLQILYISFLECFVSLLFVLTYLPNITAQG